MKQSDTPTVSRFRLGFLIHDVSRLRRTIVDKVQKPLGITRSQWWVLTNLARDPGNEMMQTELANVLDIGKVALGGLLDRLEASGYIERKADPVDRRAKRIVMTPAGATVLAGMEARAIALNREMLDVVTPDEIRQAEEILGRMKKCLMDMDAELKERSKG
ncbi:MarR family winged helix-turn-helix transcriptional regulator [Novosphingobium lentum]|uniref:MarR family winged helix-turn-helix transcriptional regulator n=1 Tax=Novosphingobium lentum TaxID=145287 RepID=UPI000830F6A3|nr:MarR family transcriptional regulator [Novosphingobium lentum]